MIEVAGTPASTQLARGAARGGDPDAPGARPPPMPPAPRRARSSCRCPAAPRPRRSARRRWSGGGPSRPARRSGSGGGRGPRRGSPRRSRRRRRPSLAARPPTKPLLQLPQARGRVVGGVERVSAPRWISISRSLASSPSTAASSASASAPSRSWLASAQSRSRRSKWEWWASRSARAASSSAAPIGRGSRRAAGAERVRSIESARQVELGGPRDPLGALVVGVDAVVLGLAGPVGGDFGGRGERDPALGHRRDDLRPALGEVLDHRPRRSPARSA